MCLKNCLKITGRSWSLDRPLASGKGTVVAISSSYRNSIRYCNFVGRYIYIYTRVHVRVPRIREHVEASQEETGNVKVEVATFLGKCNLS